MWIKQPWQCKLGITVTTAFLTKLSQFRELEAEIFAEVWFWLYGTTLIANGNLLWNAKHEMWRYQTQFRFQTENRRRIITNSKLKHTKKASLSTSLTNLYVSKLNFAIKTKKKELWKWKHKSSVGWRHLDVLLMIWTSHFLLSVSTESNKMLVKTSSKLVAKKAKQWTAMLCYPN